MPREDTSTDIRQLISDIVGTWRAMIESKGVELTCFIAEDITGNHQIETQKFHACLNTLLSNAAHYTDCLLYTSPSPRDQRGSRMPSSA